MRSLPAAAHYPEPDFIHPPKPLDTGYQDEGQTPTDIMNFGDEQLKADVDFAGKKYAADVVGELLKNDPMLTGAQIHAVLLERAEAARTR